MMTQSLVIQHARIFDGSTIIPDGTVVVQDGIITAISDGVPFHQMPS
jgi:imidazolonepropionase-like amidohydrolase